MMDKINVIMVIMFQMFKVRKYSGCKDLYQQKRPDRLIRSIVVEIVGVEPTTPCLQSRCSSQLSYTPESGCKDATFF